MDIRKIGERGLLALPCLSVCSSLSLNKSAPTGRIKIKFGITEFYENISCKLNLIKIWEGKLVTEMNIYVDLWYLTEFFLEWEMFQRRLYRKSKHILFSTVFFRKSFFLWDNIEKCGRGRQDTGQYNAAHNMYNFHDRY